MLTWGATPQTPTVRWSFGDFALRANDQLVAVARQGVAVLGPDTGAAARLRNVARFLDFISESVTRAADQARAILISAPEPSAADQDSGVTARPVD